MKFHLEEVEKIDPEAAEAIRLELQRQRNKLELIASENYVSPAVLEAMGTVLTNKYAEGYPGRRYYGGCEYVDIMEELARERAKKLFSADHANVQPHSGAQANTAVFFAVLNPGDTVMGMDLTHGGHLTHGSPVNLSGKYFQVVSYGVDRDTQLIDYDRAREIALKHRPKLIVAGTSSYPRTIDFAAFAEIAREVGAYLMVDMAHIAGLVAAGLHPSPISCADFVTTTTHKTLRGPRGGMILCRDELAKAVDKAVFPGTQGGPLMHIIAAKAVGLQEALQPEFAAYQRQIVANASVLAEELAARGFNLVSGGTDTHLVLIDVRNRNVTGKEAENLLDAAGITANKNTIPFDPEKPAVASGLRLGTPAVTTRGMREPEMVSIADAIDRVLSQNGDAAGAKEIVEELCQRFPVYE